MRFLSVKHRDTNRVVLINTSRIIDITGGSDEEGCSLEIDDSDNCTRIMYIEESFRTICNKLANFNMVA